MKKAAWIGGPIVAFLMMAPLFVAVMMITFSTAAADCLDQQQAAVPPNVPVAGEGTIRIAQANIKVSLPLAAFNADLNQTLSTGPDLVSLNEVARRSDHDLKRRGYAHYRAPNRGDDGSAVMWRTDRWAMVDAGRIVMVARGPQQWDYDRGATWVTLQSTGVGIDSGTGDGLGQVSMVSLHHMINPAKYGPNMPLRQQLYRQGLEKVQDLVTRLSAKGPVFIGGDFNSQYTDNDPWGPRKLLGAIGMKPTFDEMGRESTHDGGGIIDYLFYQPAVATPTRQWTMSLNSDHRLLVADLAVGSGAGGTAGAGTSGGGNGAAETAGDAGDVGGEDVRRRLMQVKFASDYPTMSAEQADNAIAIGQVALDELNLPRRALEVAIATAIQESKLANLDGGDRDSAGLFQQRPSTGWGSHDQVTNPRLATLAFFGRADRTSNPGLLDIPGWALMPLTQAAQAVQRSGFPDAYAQWETAAQEIAAVLTGGDLGSPLNILDATTAAAAREECEPEGGDVAYTVGTLNLLGAGHTDGGPGKQHPGFSGWETRLPKALRALRAGGVTVAGLQEVHGPQQQALANDTTWEVYPRRGKQNVVAWDPSTWEMTNARLVPIPHFGGQNVGMPLVQLTSRVDGQSIWVWSIHNPANAHGPAERHRIEALRRQVAELEPLVTSGQPVFIVGDFNDGKDGPNRAHCALTPLLENAFGGSADPCKPPTRGAPIDHIFGANVTFNSAEVDRGVQQQKVSDHPLVTASVSGGDTSCPPTDSPAEKGLTPDALLVLRCVDSEFGPHAYGGVGDRVANPGSDHPAGRAVDVMISAWNSPGGEAEGSRIAEWVREHAKELGVTHIIWRAKIWSVARSGEGWRPYTHPSGATDPTSMHMDHVHVSVAGNAGIGLGASDVVYPVPPQMAAADAHNWHESGSYWSNWHSGTDFSVPCGTPVVASHAGTIEIDRTQSWAGRWLVKVTTGPTSLTTWYAHMHTLTVDDGDQVRAGQQIGEVGGDSPVDGNVSGCHLHFEVHLRNGSTYGADNVDPSEWLEETARDAR